MPPNTCSAAERIPRQKHLTGNHLQTASDLVVNLELLNLHTTVPNGTYFLKDLLDRTALCGIIAHLSTDSSPPMKEVQMAKRKKRPTTASNEEASDRTRIIKLRLTDCECRVIRVAAAMQNLRAAEFARDVVLERSREIAKAVLRDLD